MTGLELIIPAVGAVIGALLLNRFLNRHKRARKEKFRPDPGIMTITVSDRAFTVTDSQKIKSMDTRWQDVRQVTLIRTDAGPFNDQRFYHVEFEGGDITLPEKANNMPAFVAHLATLAGFDVTAHTAALASDANNTYSRVFTA